MNTVHVDETRCLNCGRKLDAITAVNHDARPKPGDPILCFGCGTAATIDGDGRTIRPFTEDEAADLVACQEVMEQMMRAVNVLHILKARRN